MDIVTPSHVEQDVVLVLSCYTVNQISWKNKILSLQEHTD